MALPFTDEDYEVTKKTIWAEARGESEEGQKWVAWVIRNRAEKNKPYWGGNTFKGVCLQTGQFECWNDRIDIRKEPAAYDNIEPWLRELLQTNSSNDPTGGCDHYNNPDKEVEPPWVKNCDRVKKIGNHQFYKSKSL